MALNASLIIQLGGNWVRKLGHDRLLRGFGALGLGEFCNRLSRIVTTIILARYLTAVEFGIAATAITCFELIRVLANNGLGQLVVRAREEDLSATCNTAYRAIGLVCASMAVIQVLAGVVIAWITGRPELLAMVVCLAGIYAFMPAGMVQYWLLQREYRMGTIAAISTAQISTDNVITAILAVLGFGAWAIVLPNLLVAPIWLIGMRRAMKWRRDKSAGYIPLGESARYCLPILASEILVAVRGHADKVLVGGILGLEALGIYYFAFNAGYGLSSVLTNALAAVSFPHLADPKLARDKLVERFDHALVRLAIPISVIIGIQALAVFVYVPLLFGAKWEPMTTIVAVLCLSAATRSCFDLSAQMLRAGGLPNLEFAASGIFTLLLLGAFAVALPYGLLTGVTVLCILTISLQILFAGWARQKVARNTDPLQSQATVQAVG